MNSEDKFWLWIFFGVLVLLVLMGIRDGVKDTFDQIHIENMAKEGYIQKVEGTHTIWVKPNQELQ